MRHRYNSPYTVYYYTSAHTAVPSVFNILTHPGIVLKAEPVFKQSEVYGSLGTTFLKPKICIPVGSSLAGVPNTYGVGEIYDLPLSHCLRNDGSC